MQWESTQTPAQTQRRMNLSIKFFSPCFPVSPQSSVWSRDPYCLGVLRPFSMLWSSTTHFKFQLDQNVADLLFGRWIKAQFDWWRRFLTPCPRWCARSHLLPMLCVWHTEVMLNKYSSISLPESATLWITRK